MATIRKLKNNKAIHIEAKGCIVNIYEGLSDVKGRSVTIIEIIPDDHYMEERIWKLIGSRNNRVIQLKKKLTHSNKK